MTRLGRVLLPLFTLFLSISTPYKGIAADRHVGSGQTYSTIMEAVNSANAGDSIYVHAGTYEEMVSFNGRSNINLTRFGTDSVTVTGGNNTRVIRLYGGTDNIEISHLNIAPTNTTPEHCFLVGGGASTPATNVHIHDCTITGYGSGTTGTDTWLYTDNADGLNFHDNVMSGFCKYGAGNAAIRIMSSHNVRFSDNKLDCSALSTSINLVMIFNYISEDSGDLPSHFERNYFFNIGALGINTAFMVRRTDNSYFRNNVIQFDSDWNGTSVFQIRGGTDGGKGCDGFHLTNNTIVINRTSQVTLIDVADQNSNCKVTNNLVINGDIDRAMDCLTPCSDGFGNILENTHFTDSSVEWLYSPRPWASMGWSQQNNVTNQNTVWNNSGDKPDPFYALRESLDGGGYPWDPSTDYAGKSRSSPTDVGAFEHDGSNVPPTPPENVRVVGE